MSSDKNYINSRILRKYVQKNCNDEICRDISLKEFYSPEPILINYDAILGARLN